MHRLLAFAIAAALGLGLSLALPALARDGYWDYDSTLEARRVVVVQDAEAGTTVLGTGASVTCATTPAVVDDASVANTLDRSVLCCNPPGNTVTVRIGAATVGANAPGVEPGQCWGARMAANITPYCYAASNTVVQCSEAL